MGDGGGGGREEGELKGGVEGVSKTLSIKQTDAGMELIGCLDAQTF